MKIFMTGATGFVGRRILARLLDAGHAIRCLVRPGSERKLPQKAEITPVLGEIHEPATFEPEIAGCDAVIHLVGIIAEVGRNTFAEVHTLGTQSIVDAMRVHGVRRLLHMSALGARPGSRSVYHRTKYDAEVYIRSSFLDYTIFRPSIIHGPDGEFVRLLKRLASLPVHPVPGTGTALLQPVYVEDVADLFVSSLSMPETIGRSYGVGGPRQCTFPEMLNMMSVALGKPIRRARQVPLWLIFLPTVFMEVVFPVFGMGPPLNTDQFIMLEEDNVCDSSEIEEVFRMKLAEFPKSLGAYVSQIGR